MESSPLTQQSRPSSFQPKIDQLYDELLTPSDEEVTFSDGFWREFFLLKPDQGRLQQRLEGLSADNLLHLQRETQQLFGRSISEIRQSVGPIDQHAFDTLIVFLSVIFAKKYTNPSSDTITVIAGLDEVDKVMSDFANAIEHCLKNGRSAEIRQKTLSTALALTAGAYQTSLVSYFSYRDLFPALMKYVQDTEISNAQFEPFLLLGLLANYNKFEFRNPYRARLEDFVNEPTIVKIVRGFGKACASSRNRYVSIQEDIAEGWSLSTALNYIGLGMLAPTKPSNVPPKQEDVKQDFTDLPDPSAAVLLAAFDFSAANKLFGYNLISCSEDPKGTESPLNAFLSLTSYILHHAYRSSRAQLYGMLNILILRIYIEDLGHCKMLCDPATVLSVRLCRQRQPFLPATPRPRPAAAAILDIYIDTINHNLRRNLDIQLYIAVVESIHRLLSYLTFTRTRLEYHWPLLWQTLLSFLRFLTNYASTFIHQLDVGLLVRPLLATLALAALSGETFLPTSAAYDDLFYKLVESGDSLDRFKKVYAQYVSPESGSMGAQNSTVPNANGPSHMPIDILMQVSSHYYSLVEQEKGRGKVGKNPSPREVSKVIKQGYDTLTLPGMEGLDRWDRFREADERGLLKRAARYAVEDARRLLQT